MIKCVEVQTWSFRPSLALTSSSADISIAAACLWRSLHCMGNSGFYNEFSEEPELLHVVLGYLSLAGFSPPYSQTCLCDPALPGYLRVLGVAAVADIYLMITLPSLIPKRQFLTMSHFSVSWGI